MVSIGRSGTSLLSRVLHEVLGVDFGEEKDHIPRNHNNPDGYFENREFLEINERILAAAGGAVLQPPPLGFMAGLSVAKRAGLVADIRLKLGAYSQNKLRFGWKDPRLSLTLPLWNLADPTLVPIVVFRDPAAVLRSIAAQLSTQPEALGGLWFEYYRRIFAYTRDSRRLVLGFRQLVESPLAVTEAMARHLGIPAEPELWRAKLAEIVKPGQVRHGGTGESPSAAFVDSDSRALFDYLESIQEQGLQPDSSRLQAFFG